MDARTVLLDSSSSFQVLLDFCSEWIIIPSKLLVEVLVSLVDVVNVGIIIMSSSPAELGSFFNPSKKRKNRFKTYVMKSRTCNSGAFEENKVFK